MDAPASGADGPPPAAKPVLNSTLLPELRRLSRRAAWTLLIVLVLGFANPGLLWISWRVWTGPQLVAAYRV